MHRPARPLTGRAGAAAVDRAAPWR
jgi:hypothetical protein